ncbi:MAG: hypothetical protein R2867_02885 [Caldilineaceae bacterium]
MSALSLEATGFANRGEGWRLAQEDAIGINGQLPLSTMGGLKSVAATRWGQPVFIKL